jgi:hypothetical protein
LLGRERIPELQSQGDPVQEELATMFDQMRTAAGRPSIPPQQLPRRFEMAGLLSCGR